MNEPELRDATTRRVLTVSDLDVRFRGGARTVHAVQGLSLHVDEGETVAIVGESGSGKSVTSLAIMRLIEQAGGRIAGGHVWLRQCDGRDVELTALRQTQMQRLRGADLAMVFQEPMTSLNPVFRVGEQIAESIRLHQRVGATAARAESLRMLDLVRIPEARDVMDRFPHQLSGGMRQRVMIAMALSSRPRLLIADEPTTALDVTIQAQILALIAQLQRDLDMGVMFITHDMGVVAEIADRVVVMLRGRAVEENGCRALFAQPQHPYTRALLAAVPRLGSMRGHDAPQPFDVVTPAGTQPPHAGVPWPGGLRGEASRPDAPAPDALVPDAPVPDAPVPDAPVPDATAPDAAGPGDVLLSVRDLVTRFALRSGVLDRVTRQVHAVEHVSFDLRAGETLALVGESGSGKSTLGRSIARLVDPQSGDVRLNGRDVAGLRGAALQALRRDVQFIFQDPFASLDPRLTVGYSVLEPMLVHATLPRAQGEARVRELLERVGLPADAAQRYPHEFSGGQRQRIAIARALALDPRLIVADEAVAALDVSIRAHVINLLMELQRERGIAYLFISHDMAVVERISHRVAVMYLGQIVEIGPRAAVFGQPMHPYTRRLLQAVPVADPTQRRERVLDAREIPSPVRRVGDDPVVAPLVQVAPQHWVAMHEVGGIRFDDTGARAA